MIQRDADHLRIDFGFGINRDKDGMSISRDESTQALKRIKAEAVRLFSAYTLIPSYGGWTNGSGRLVEEDGFTLFVVVKSSSLDEDNTWDSTAGFFANFIKEQLNQEAIAVSITPCRFGLI